MFVCVPPYLVEGHVEAADEVEQGVEAQGVVDTGQLLEQAQQDEALQLPHVGLELGALAEEVQRRHEARHQLQKGKGNESVRGKLAHRRHREEKEIFPLLFL